MDKILYAAEIFPVIHSKKANEIKGKWSELLSVVLSKLLNYAKDHVHYGVFFMEPVNPEKDNCPDYKRVVQHPIDLGTLSNRVYLNFYRCFADIWRDIGYVFKNCRMYNVNDQTDVRILGDTLREYAKILYKRWYSLQLEKYNSLVDEIVEKQREHIEAHPEDRENVEKEILEETDGLLKTLFGLLDRGIEAIERSEVERSDRELLKTIKMQFSQEISVKASLLGEDSQVLSQIFRDLERVFSFSLGLEVAKVELNRLKSFILDTINSNQQALIQKRFEAFLITSLNLLTSEEIQMFHPGDYSLNWVKDNEDHDVDNEEFVYFEDHEIESVDLLSPVDKAYLVKWANMSYLDTTWELESLIYSDQHIKDFLNFNRSQDKESRNNYLGQLSRHRNLLELMNNPKKKAKTPYQTVNEYKNKLYNLDIAKRDSLFQYTQTSQFIFKHK